MVTFFLVGYTREMGTERKFRLGFCMLFFLFSWHGYKQEKVQMFRFSLQSHDHVSSFYWVALIVPFMLLFLNSPAHAVLGIFGISFSLSCAFFLSFSFPPSCLFPLPPSFLFSSLPRFLVLRIIGRRAAGTDHGLESRGAAWNRGLV